MGRPGYSLDFVYVPRAIDPKARITQALLSYDSHPWEIEVRRLFWTVSVLLLVALTSCGEDQVVGIARFSTSLNDDTVFMGDSITYLWSLPEHNDGINGQRTLQMLARFSADVLGHGYKRVVILGGTNDVNLPIQSLDNIAPNLEAMATMARTAGIEVVLCKIPPIVLDGVDRSAKVDSVNNAISALAESEGYLLVDYNTPMRGHPEYFKDGIHPSRIGYAVMETALSRVVVR